ncbi:hypothetical protein [Bowmanella dokdonensis]|uniref:Uncharacterized protein n=1 Tax=Bowmanella dokdonensis TaxID=751969 RepID=A0A939IMW0_9ALTE|nr:hypothetical protein [Bowmanella dokdonensis]MBN7825718.1 hypothetical protein [Bowmanella dokdonensis]
MTRPTWGSSIMDVRKDDLRLSAVIGVQCDLREASFPVSGMDCFSGQESEEAMA